MTSRSTGKLFLAEARQQPTGPKAAPERNELLIDLHALMVARTVVGLYTLTVCICGSVRLYSEIRTLDLDFEMPVSKRRAAVSLALEDEASGVADTLYREHGNWLMAFLRRRFAPHEAEDLAQDTFVQLVATKAKIENPRAFLARLALNAAGMQARRRLARPILVSDTLIPPGLCEPSDQEESLFLEQAVVALPPRVREVFAASRFGGLTNEEIARRYGISVKTVEARISKALKICTALLD